MQDFYYKTRLRPRTATSNDIARAEVRFDDRCKNGHQTFSVTGTLFGTEVVRGEECITYNNRLYWCWGGGACHEDIATAFPELQPYIKWHLTSTDGPMHYLANGRYWAELWQASLDPAHPLAVRKDTYLTRYTPEQLRDHFCKTVVIENSDPLIASGEDGIVGWSMKRITDWLAERKPAMVADFMADMEKVCELQETLV